jgi:hypothetical protein
MSKLEKKDIQFIDTYLKEKGVSYWDIRLEMTDHIACVMESKTGNYDFQSLFKDTVNNLGWDRSLKDYEQRQLRIINKTVRAKYFKSIGEAFRTLKSLVLITIFVCLYYILFQTLSLKAFGLLSFLLVGIPVIYFTVHYAYMTAKHKKSGYLFYGYFYIIFSMLMSSMFYQIPRPDGLIEVSIAIRQNIIFFTTIFNVLFISSGIKVYLQIHQQYSMINKRLSSY